MSDLEDRLRLEAQVQAQEARTQRATVHECYQAVGAKKGDWNGAKPVQEAVARLTEQRDELLAACKRALNLLEMSGSGRLAKTPAGDDLRAAIAKCEGPQS
jgi:hypothetical protein